MRLRYYVLTAFVVSRWRAAGAAESATTGKNSSSSATRHSPAVPTRLKTAIMPRYSKSHASAVDIDDVNEITEMRGPPLLMEAIQELCLHKEVLPGMHSASYEEMQMLEFYPIYSHWRTYDNARSTHDIYGENDVAEMANFFHWLRNVEGMEDRADVMQKFLLDRYPQKAVATIFKHWAELNFHPRFVYHKLGIGALELSKVSGLPDDEIWSTYCHMVMQWLDYVDMYRVTTHHAFSDAEVLNFLVTQRSMKEVLKLIVQLRRDPTTKVRGDQLSKALLHVDTNTT